jgi:hypothetical protein
MTQENSTAIGMVRYNHETGSFFIDVMPGFEYDIHRSRLSSREEVQDWIDHLSQKTWGPDALLDLKRLMQINLPASCLDESEKVKE